MTHNQSLIDPHSSIIVKAMNAGTWEWNVQTGELQINERWAEIAGYTLEELEPISIKTWENLAHPKDLIKSNRVLEDVFNKKMDFYSVEVRIRHKNGHWLWVLDSGQIIKWTDDGKPLIALGTHIDRTDIKNTQVALEHSERNLRQIMENTKDIIYRLDLNGNFTYLSKAWNNLLGHNIQESLNRSFSLFIHPDDLNKASRFLEKVKQTSSHQNFRGYRLKSNDGAWRYFETTASAIIEDNIILGYAGIARDITDLMIKQNQIEYLSYHDQLTKFYNRHYLEKAEKEINQSENFPLCVISIDLNNLKHANDTYGHQVGDKLLIKAAEIIRNNTYYTDYLFRMGGDEFLIFLPKTNEEEVLNIRDNINAEVKEFRRKDFPLSLAFGYHIHNNPSSDLYEIVRIADRYMYQNKREYKLFNLEMV